MNQCTKSIEQMHAHDTSSLIFVIFISSIAFHISYHGLCNAGIHAKSLKGGKSMSEDILGGGRGMRIVSSIQF